jgi:hypothetical protein
MKGLWPGWILLLTACAPWMETQYSFLPPQDPQGQACVASCSVRHSACVKEAEKTAAEVRTECETIARQDYELCQLRAPAGDGREPCQVRRCDAPVDTALCDAPYRACFQECGGFVETRQVCTFNC